MPSAMVVDISHHNANVNFSKVKAAGVVGVIHKATQGKGYVDPLYAQRKTAALQAGLLWGAYHFSTGEDVNIQVSHFINTVHPDGTFLLVLDFEKNEADPSNSMSLAQAKTFLTAVQNQTGQKPVIYTGSYLYDVAGAQPDAMLAQYRVWWARYSNTPQLHPTWQSYWLWQYTDGHNGPQPRSVDGIGYCDCDDYNGTAAQLSAGWLA